MARSSAPAAAPAPARPPTPAPASASASPRPPAPPAPAPPVADPAAVKSSILASIRESNKVFYGMVIAQAQKIEVEGDSLVFTFAPVHKTLKARLEEKRGWIEQLATSASGRKLMLATKEGAPIAPAPTGDDGGDAKKAALKARAQAEPSVQAVLDVFGGEIEDVEEIKES
jgi:DNA polymerase-3 subunit gamma/tau